MFRDVFKINLFFQHKEQAFLLENFICAYRYSRGENNFDLFQTFPYDGAKSTPSVVQYRRLAKEVVSRPGQIFH